MVGMSATHPFREGALKRMVVASSPGRNLEDSLIDLGLSQTTARLFGTRRDHSNNRMSALTRELERSPAIAGYPGLSIFATGSYARGEASLHSDVDLFFINDCTSGSVIDPNLRQIKVMSDVIRATEGKLGFPAPSNDGEFLKVLTVAEILKDLGGREDDYKNHFTARMLLLLESSPIIGAPSYDIVIDSVLDSYLRDYEDHIKDFRPTFIVNDVIRFWKTLCLNYEHKRNQQEEARKIKQKIRNFKLSYSRLMTCFATVGLLSSYRQITKGDLVDICRLTPIERLLLLSERQPLVKNHLIHALQQYHWFLEKTENTTKELETYFADKNNRSEAFTHASKFGDAIYNVVHTAATQSETLRFLVV